MHACLVCWLSRFHFFLPGLLEKTCFAAEEETVVAWAEALVAAAAVLLTGGLFMKTCLAAPEVILTVESAAVLAAAAEEIAAVSATIEEPILLSEMTALTIF